MRVRAGVVGAMAVVLAVAGGGSVAWGQRFTAGLDVSAESQRVSVLLGELGGGDPIAAARGWAGLRELLLRDETVLLPAGEGQRVSGLGAVLRGLDGPQREGLVRATADDLTMQREWESLEQRDADVPELIRFARRAGPSVFAGKALVRAGGYLQARGDHRSAQELLARAKQWGADPGDLVVDSVSDPTPASKPGVLAEHWWFNKMPDRLGGTRCVVAQFGEGGDGADLHVFLASATHVIALRGGQVVWGWPEVPAPGPSRRPVSDGASRLEFPVYGVVNAAGGGEVLLARMEGDGGGVIRALRASDGRELWSTEGGDGETARLHFASMPVVAGGFAYAVAADTAMVNGGGAGGAGGGGAGGAKLYLVGLELMTGRTVFKTPLGVLSDVAVAARGRGKAGAAELRAARAPGLWDELTAPTVDGDRVIVTPGGVVFAIDRFDGTILRGTGYLTPSAVAKEGNAPSELAMSRWQATPVVTDKLIIIAPRDADAVMALDRSTLAPAWTTTRTGAYTLVGVAGSGGGVAGGGGGGSGGGRGEGKLIVQGNELLAISLADGQRGWQTAPRTQTRFNGPAVIVGEIIVVPTTEGPMAMSASTGQWLPEVPVRLPELRAWFVGETAGILRAANVLSAFMSPSAVAEFGGSGADAPAGPNRTGRGPQRIVPGPKAGKVTPENLSPPPLDAKVQPK